MQEGDVIDQDPNADSGGKEFALELQTFVCSFVSTLVGDTITALEYSSTGEYLATGDRNGRITVLRMDMEAKAQVQQFRKCYRDLL